VTFSLPGIAGTDPGAGQARASSQNADAYASAAGGFRALVDVLAKDDVTSTTTSDAVPHDGVANLTDDDTALVEATDAATNSTAASVHAAFNAAWAGAPSSTSSEEGESHAADGSRSTGDDARAAGTTTPSQADDTVVAAVWIAEAPAPLAPVPVAAGNGQGTGDDSTGEHADLSAGTDVRTTFAEASAAGNSLSADDRAAEAFEAVLDEAAQTTRDVAKELAGAIAAARAARQATAADTANAASDAARASAPTNTIANVVRAATASRGEAVHASAAATVVPQLMTSGGSTSFSGLMTGLSNGAPSSNANALPDTTAAQIVQTLRITVMGNGGEATITLDPNQFGELRVSIRVEQGQVVARMEADSPVVREWLQANHNLLRQQLGDQNLTLNRLEIHEPSEPNSTPRERRESTDDQASQDGRPQRRRREPDANERFEVVA